MINPSPTEIKAWRESVGLTQAQAAALIGYTARAWEPFCGPHRQSIPLQAAKPLILQADKPHFERLLSQFLPLLFAERRPILPLPARRLAL